MPEQNNFCDIYLVRHGESVGNAKNIIMGHFDLPLTEKGETQAKETGEKLKDIHFDTAYSSDLLRAKHTAEIILAERNLVIQTSRMLRERTYGSYEGKSSLEDQQAINRIFEEIAKLSEEERKNHQFPDGIESNESMITRMLLFIREIAVANPGKTVLIATHGTVLRNFLTRVGFASREEFKLIEITNGAYVRILSDGIEFIVKETYGIIKAV